MNPRALAKVQEKIRQHVIKRGEELREIVADIHDRAPRGGGYLNDFGQPRSAPGEQPASEYGNLMNLIERGPEVVSYREVNQIVNYIGQEFGTVWRGHVVEPRSMGRMASEAFKQQVRSGG